MDEEDEGEFHPLMALATKHLVERNKILMKNANAGGKNLKYGGTGNWGAVRRDSRRRKHRLGRGGIVLTYEGEDGKVTPSHSRKPSKELKRSLKVIKEGASGAHAKVFAGEMDTSTDRKQRKEYGVLSLFSTAPVVTASHTRVAIKTPHRFISNGIGHSDVDSIGDGEMSQ